MGRLIDADDLKKRIKFGMYYVGELMCMIDDCKTVDAEPVRHGKWLLEREPDGNPHCFHCSACDDDFHYVGIKTASKYCPNCGAKMDLDD